MIIAIIIQLISIPSNTIRSNKNAVKEAYLKNCYKYQTEIVYLCRIYKLQTGELNRIYNFCIKNINNE